MDSTQAPFDARETTRLDGWTVRRDDMAALNRFGRSFGRMSEEPAGGPVPTAASIDLTDGSTGNLLPADAAPIDRSAEDALRARLVEDPNDTEAFDQLAQVVRRIASEGHKHGDPQREADDAVWALAEEVAGNGRAWYPLIELGRLSIDDDRESALRRLGTAAERDPSGEALARALATLREAGHPVDALNLGVGHWRPREHVVAAGRQLIEAAIEAGRHSEARRHLDSLALNQDQASVAKVRAELESRMAQADRDTGMIPRVTL